VTALRVVKTFKATCERCQYVWKTDDPPKRCPHCKSAYWRTKPGQLPMGRPPVGTRGKARRK